MSETSTATATTDASSLPLVEMRDIRVAFGGVHAVEGVTLDLYPGEVVSVVGGNGAGKSTMMHTLSGAHPADSGEILINGEVTTINNPRDARAAGIESIYQTLALADNMDAAANVFLGREMLTRTGALDDSAMASATREVMHRLNPRFTNLKTAVSSLSGGQRQAVAIARAIHFNARILIMDEPTAALGPAETGQVHELVAQLKSDGIGIFLISHDIHDVFDLSDRISVMLQSRLVGTVRPQEVTKDEVAHLRRLHRPERRGGLVHDQDLGLEVHGTGDGHRLTLATRQRPHRRAQVLEPRVEPRHQLLRGGRHGRIIE